MSITLTMKKVKEVPAMTRLKGAGKAYLKLQDDLAKAKGQSFEVFAAPKDKPRQAYALARTLGTYEHIDAVTRSVDGIATVFATWVDKKEPKPVGAPKTKKAVDVKSKAA